VRHLWLIVLLSFACDKGGKPADNAPAAPVADVRAGFDDPLALVPADSDILIRVDVAAVRTSPWFAKYERLVLEYLFPAFLECEYDPLKEVTTVTVGIPMDSEQGVFVVRGLDRDKTLDCLRSSKATTNTTVAFDGEFVTLTNKSGAVNLLTFPEPKVMVMQGSKNPTKETMNAALKSGAPIRANRMFVALMDKLPPGATLAMVSRPDSKRFTNLLENRVGARARHMYGTLHVTDRVTAKFVLVLKDPKDAATLEAQMRPQVEASKPYMERFDVRAAGDSLTMEFSMTEAQISAMVDMVKSMMGPGE
jgi:hypothetical protein